MKVRDLMVPVRTCGINLTLLEIAKIFYDQADPTTYLCVTVPANNTKTVAVAADENLAKAKLVGIVTTSDFKVEYRKVPHSSVYIPYLFGEPLNPKLTLESQYKKLAATVQVKHCMTKRVVTLDVNDQISTPNDFRKISAYRHVPVLDQGILVGIIDQNAFVALALN
jgi:CBS domain-containing protein